MNNHIYGMFIVRKRILFPLSLGSANYTHVDFSNYHPTQYVKETKPIYSQSKEHRSNLEHPSKFQKLWPLSKNM